MNKFILLQSDNFEKVIANDCQTLDGIIDNYVSKSFAFTETQSEKVIFAYPCDEQGCTEWAKYEESVQCLVSKIKKLSDVEILNKYIEAEKSFKAGNFKVNAMLCTELIQIFIERYSLIVGRAIQETVSNGGDIVAITKHPDVIFTKLADEIDVYILDNFPENQCSAIFADKMEAMLLTL